MKATKQVLLFLSGLCASVSAEAVGPSASALFYIEDPATHTRTHVLEARLDQNVCLSIRASLVPAGEHALQLTIYDGEGREVHKSESHRVATNQSLGRLICTTFDEDHDAPGTWWYVVELDGELLVSESIEIRNPPSRTRPRSAAH